MINSERVLSNWLDVIAEKIGEQRANLDPTQFLNATNEALRIYYDNLREWEPERLRTVSASISVPATGYDITQEVHDYTDINGNTTQKPSVGTHHIKVYENGIDYGCLLPRVKQGDVTRGYYFIGDTLFINGGDSANIVIEFEFRTPRISAQDENFDWDSTLIPIDQDIEDAFEEYVIARYKRSEGEDFDGALGYGHALERFQQDLSRFFRPRLRPMVIHSVSRRPRL